MAQLGDKVRDEVTGFEGVVTGRFEYLYGCVRCAVQPQNVKNEKPVDSVVFDEDQLQVLEEQAIVPITVRRANRLTTGGPRSDPTNRADPVR